MLSEISAVQVVNFRRLSRRGGEDKIALPAARLGFDLHAEVLSLSWVSASADINSANSSSREANERSVGQSLDIPGSLFGCWPIVELVP